MIKYIVSDLDDTLLNDSQRISRATQDAVFAARDIGVETILASGRMYKSMRPYAEQLNISLPALACNGAEIVDTRTNKVIHKEYISAELARVAAEFAERHNAYVQVYIGDDYFFDKKCKWSDYYEKTSGVTGIEAGRLSEHIAAEASKLLYIGQPEDIKRLLRLAQKEFDGRLCVTASKSYYVEITHPRATKGLALSKLMGMLSVEPENVIAFGDGLNDIPMLQAAGTSVAVANAREETKQIADHVTLSNQQDGVADYILKKIIKK